jgi:hypothetical protein
MPAGNGSDGDVDLPGGSPDPINLKPGQWTREPLNIPTTPPLRITVTEKIAPKTAHTLQVPGAEASHLIIILGQGGSYRVLIFDKEIPSST